MTHLNDIPLPLDHLSALLAEDDTFQYLEAVETLIELIGKNHNRRAILTKTLPLAMTVGQADIGALLVVENIDELEGNAQNPRHLVLVNQYNVPEEIINHLLKGDLGQQLYTGHNVWVGLKSMRLEAMQTLLEKHHLRGLLALPLQFNGHVLGAFVIGARNENAALFEPEIRHRLSTLANLLSLFLDHVRLEVNTHLLKNFYAKQGPAPTKENGNNAAASEPPSMIAPPQPLNEDFEELLAAVMSAEEEVVSYNQDLDMLNTLSTQVGGTLNLEQILERAIGSAKNALTADAGWVYLLQDDLLVLHSQQGLSAEYVAGMHSIKVGDGSEGMAFQKQSPILRDSSLFHDGPARKMILAEGLKTVAAIPLVHQDIPFGVLAVGNYHEHDWSSRDERMLVSISQQVSQAVGNARSYSQVNSKAHELELKNAKLQKVNRELLNEFEALKHQIQDMLRYQERTWIMLANATPIKPETAEYLAEDIQVRHKIVSALKRVLDQGQALN
jgi:GAF domain-containing protein